MIVVQHIETRWTKRSRGMPGAAARNAVPRVMPLPASPDEAAGIRVHKVTAREEHSFDLHQQTEIIAPGQGFTRYWTLYFVWTLYFTVAELGGVVELEYEEGEHGLPPRRENRHPIFRLGPGQVGTLHINGRFSYSSGQYYKQHFVNIANAETTSYGMFMRAPADFFAK